MSQPTHIATGEFTVIGARNRGTTANPHGGQLVKWYVDLQNSGGEQVKDSSGKPSDCYWQRKEGSNVEPGDKVYGTITEGEYGLRFKMEQRPDGFSGGSTEVTGNGGKSGKTWQPEAERDPERAARILRQHSQEMALRFMAVTGQKVGSVSEVFQVADKFDQDVLEKAQRVLLQPLANSLAGQTASQGQPPAQKVDAPPPSVSPDSQPTDDAQHFSHLMEQAGENATAAHALGQFVAEKFKPEQKQRAEDQLKDEHEKHGCLAKLRTTFEQTTGSLVPAPGDDDIPF